MTHICVGQLTIIGSDNGLSPERRQAIIWTNAGILLIGHLGTNFIEILIEIQAFPLKKMCLKMSSVKCCSFHLDLNVLMRHWKITHMQYFTYRQASNISGTLVGNKIADHSDVVEASPVGAAPTTCSFSTQHRAKTTARRDETFWDFIYSFDFMIYNTLILLCRCKVAMNFTLHWRHNDHDGVSNHQPHGCLLNHLFRRRSKKTPKLRVTGLCAGNSLGPVNPRTKGQ